MSYKKVIVLLSVCLLMGILLSLDIKKAGKPSSGNNKNGRLPVTKSIKAFLNIDSLELKDLSTLNPAQEKNIRSLEGKLNSKSTFEDYLNIGSQWSKISKNLWAGHYFYKAAELNPNLVLWLKAGNSLNEALAVTSDSTSQKLIFLEASTSFKNALLIDSSSLDAKTGLGVSYVAGSDNPMQGISLLLSVITKDPKNVKANFSLGLFSMKSGQYQKAINRFRTVVSKEPSGEAYFYMAQAYQNLNQKKEAIDSYLQSKKYIDDPQTISSIDHLVKELTN
jgi:tetratricopeptide (TPR) repeat protein